MQYSTGQYKLYSMRYNLHYELAVDEAPCIIPTMPYSYHLGQGPRSQSLLGAQLVDETVVRLEFR